MKQLLTCLLVLLVAAWLPARPAAGQSLPDRAALVTRLGDDTLSVERWVRTEHGLVVDAVVRSPRATWWRYLVDLGPDGHMTRFGAQEMGVPDPAVETVERTGDAWTRTTWEEGEKVAETIEASADLLPFIDLLSWPYEVALLRGVPDEERVQPLLAGTRVLPFTIQSDGPGAAVVAHPTRGPSHVRVDDAGRVLALDAGETTRKVVVTREPWDAVPVDDIALRWRAEDAAGRGVGELSGRAEETYRVGAATLDLDYGTPTKRGRAIFGEVVPWGERWRTGANRATHLATDRALVLAPGTPEALEVPPGTYTLFSIPEPSGGLLLVNRQTGQNGQTYDPAQDLGRVPLTAERLGETVERFTIRAVETGEDAGELRIEWDDTALVLPFEVR